MRYRDGKPADLDRARVAVKAWRDEHPEGTPEQLVAALGCNFHRDYGVVLRGVLAAVDRTGPARSRPVQVTGPCPELHVVGHAIDPLERRRRFEETHSHVTILSPGSDHSRWMAVFPPNSDKANPERVMTSGWELEHLMDDLERIWPPGE